MNCIVFMCCTGKSRSRAKSSADVTTKEHVRKPSSQNSYSCHECKKCFSTANGWSIHMNIHSDKYKCSVCGKRCYSRQSLTGHRRTHSGEKPFGCSVCGKRFTMVAQLTVHNRIHSGVKVYKCSLCDKAFNVSSSLTVHMRVHTGEKPFKCPLCDKSFRQSCNLQSHKRHAHSNSRQLSCPYCGKQFVTVTDVERHVRVHTGVKPFWCRHCSETFKSHHQLKVHLLKSHNEGTWFTCHICRKKFSLNGHLKQHMQRHEGVKPYVCDECPKRFCTANELKMHQPVHSDYREFSCFFCDARFKRKRDVNRHCSAVHSEDPLIAVVVERRPRPNRTRTARPQRNGTRLRLEAGQGPRCAAVHRGVLKRHDGAKLRKSSRGGEHKEVMGCGKIYFVCFKGC